MLPRTSSISLSKRAPTTPPDRHSAARTRLGVERPVLDTPGAKPRSSEALPKLPPARSLLLQTDIARPEDLRHGTEAPLKMISAANARALLKPVGLAAIAGIAYAFRPADKYAAIPMGFAYEKEAVGEAPVLAEEFAPAVKRGSAH
mmetsp:Transcript_3738/g.11050  ORF Transcript_3738/g.11050 Transcript_3738/m.11050 type:complete len:146 (-) Transcript_3738:36-473(-)